MKKGFFVFIILSFCFQGLIAQNKSQRRIYLWDVTLSTKGFLGKTPDIYDDIVDFLKREINSLTDESTDIVVLPFQEKVLENWTVKATEAGKKSIIHKIEQYNNTDVTNTNIERPIREVQAEYIANDKRNILFLLTDGKQSGGNKNLLALIRDWGRYAKINDAYAVYVMLTDEAKDQEVIDVIKQTNNIEVITEPGKIDWIDLQPVQLAKFNIKDDKGKPANIALVNRKNIVLPDNIKVNVSSPNNPYLTINETVVVKNNAVSFNLEYNYLHLRDSLPETMRIPIYIELQNQKEIQKETGKIVLLNPNELELELINKPEKTMKIHVKRNK